MTPRPYQLIGRDWLAARTRALLADQMRVGKTPQAIMAADKIGAERVLVLCPAIASYQWQAQWGEWSTRAPAVILGREPPPADFKGVLIASYNRAVQHQERLANGPRWDVLIVDEAHYAKSPDAQRTKLAYGKGGVGWNATCIWALTGTPSPNHAGELWPLLRAFGAVRIDYKAFVSHFCYYDWKTDRVYGNRFEHLSELRALLAPFTLRRTLAQVAPQMPRIAYNLFAVEPQPGVDLRSSNPDDVDTEDRIAVALAKAPELAKEIEDNLLAGNYRQTVAFGYHVAPLKALGEMLTAAGYDVSVITGETPLQQRENKLAAFKAGVCQVLICQMIAAGTAIDLSAAQHGYFLELDWTPANNSQAAHRLVNIQTKLPVTMDVLNWPGTKDDAVQRTLLRKLRGAVFKG
jgi:SNF2 family DNA or RNA helicase